MVKLLIVDDSVFMRTVIRDIVSKDPTIEVVGTASNGIEALEKITSLEPDIITLDIEMPKMNGIQVLEELRKVKKRPRVTGVSAAKPGTGTRAVVLVSFSWAEMSVPEPVAEA